LRRGCLVCARLAVKTYYPHLASLEVHAPAVVGRILCIFVVDPGGSSLFSHKRSLPTAGELDRPNFALTEFSEDEMRRPTLNAVPYGLQTLYGL
jgi:hypothetical protein